jgi:hypothetical protein
MSHTSAISHTSALMAAVTDEPASTSDLYERIGYPTLARLGLIPYAAFRAALARLAASGALESQAAPDGSTTWRRAPRSDPAAAHSDPVRPADL